MKTPIVDFVENYAKNRPIRLHMPGHKGNFGMQSAFDVTEIDGADSLYLANGIILESEDNATKLFQSRRTFYSTEGSSLAIRAMLALATFGKERPLILACRNAHKVFLTTASLLKFDVEWIYGDGLLECDLTAKILKEEIEKCSRLPSAVYVTSPDYLGHMLDVKALGEVCHSFGIMLLVDNAHGSYLKFLPKSKHPIDLGADLCCDSAHKTLPVLTGGAYLHVGNNAPSGIENSAKEFLGLFGSTSPSYLILQSLDLANKFLFENAKDFGKCSAKVNLIKKILLSRGFELYGEEQWKITIKTKSVGYLGEQLYHIFKNNNIVCEYYDKDNLTLMFSPLLGVDDFAKIEKVVESIEVLPKIEENPPIITKGEKVLSISEAYFSKKKTVLTENSLGLVLAEPSVTCPPAVPILICGERINQSHIETFLYYGINNVIVIDE